MITVLNLTPTRAFDANSVSIDTLADVIGTLIEDVQDDTYLGSAWTVLNGTTDRALDAGSFSPDELADVVATFIADNPLTFQVFNVTFTNLTPNLSLDCDSTSLNELARVFGTFAPSIPRIYAWGAVGGPSLILGV